MRWTDIGEHELRAVLWSFAYFFCLLCGYYVLRPIRDEMGIQIGVGNLAWLFTATFVAMLAVVPAFGWVSSRFPRRRFLPYVYLFFVANLLVFFVLFREKIAVDQARTAFFVWVSVFNLFVVSVFWSFMADLYDTAQARRLYGFIAAGGSCRRDCRTRGDDAARRSPRTGQPAARLRRHFYWPRPAASCNCPNGEPREVSTPAVGPSSGRRTVRRDQAGAGVTVPDDDLRVRRAVQHLVHVPLLRAAADREERDQLVGAAHAAVRGGRSGGECLHA